MSAGESGELSEVRSSRFHPALARPWSHDVKGRPTSPPTTNRRSLVNALLSVAARHEMEVNYLGNLAVSRAFTPILGANGGGAMVNVLSILSRINHPGMATYCASKAALHSVTQAFRAQLRGQGTFVCAFMPGAVDTRLTAHLPIPKMTAEETAAAMIDAIRNDVEDAYPGDMAGGVSAGLAADHKAVEAQFAEFI